MQKTELIWTFEQFNRYGAFDRTLDALRKDSLSVAAQFARLDHARLLGAVREGPSSSKLGERKLPPFYLKEVKKAIGALEEYLESPEEAPVPAPAPPPAPLKLSSFTPAEKKAARLAALERAEYRCESCGLPNYAVGYRKDNGEFVPCSGDDLKNYAGKGLSWPSGERLTKAEAREIREMLNCTLRRQTKCDARGRHWLVVDLAALPKDADESNYNADNMIVLCRRCWTSKPTD